MFIGNVVTGGGGGLNLTFSISESEVNLYGGARVQWTIAIPRQVVTNQNSAGWSLRVYEVGK